VATAIYISLRWPKKAEIFFDERFPDPTCKFMKRIIFWAALSTVEPLKQKKQHQPLIREEHYALMVMPHGDFRKLSSIFIRTDGKEKERRDGER
jgi:hypothetical protein